MKNSAKINYKRNRIVSGHAPHKLFKLTIKGYLKKLKKEKEDLFDINRIQWKELKE